MTDSTLPRCSRTARIVDAILDGSPTALDRAHLATCATCSRAAERAAAFTESLVATAIEASDGIPDAALIGGQRARIGRAGAGRLTLRILTLAGAVAAGLVIATLIGSRALAPTGRGPSIFGPSDAAQQRLEGQKLTCTPDGAVVECLSKAPGHVHRVVLTLEDGQITQVVARIDSTDGKKLDLSGADVMMARFAAAVTSAETRSDVVNWISRNFMDCGGSCTGDLANVHLEGSLSDKSVVLTLTQP
jgi:hypothetical protein